MGGDNGSRAADVVGKVRMLEVLMCPRKLCGECPGLKVSCFRELKS